MKILITGGASGLGEAITQKLAKNSDDTIFFTFRSSIDKADYLKSKFNNVQGIKCDFLNQLDINNLLTFIENTDLDILINNAFISEITTKYFHKTDISIFTNNINANIIPVIKITQKAIINFRKKRFGKIITILSSAIIGNPPIGWSEYSAEKAYLASLCKSWAIENISFNISSNSISPSFMQTSLTQNTDDRVIEEMKLSHPLKQILPINDVAETVLFFSKCSQHINGVNLIINAGSYVI